MAKEVLVESFREQTPSRAESVYVLLVSTFLAILLITNLITAKYFVIGTILLTAGAITYPFTFLLNDIITEVYGKRKAKLAVWLGLMASIFMVVILQIANGVPIYEGSPVEQRTFQSVFSFTPGIVLGSMVAYLVAQFTDIYLFSFCRRLTKGKHLWLRNNVSTLISQLLDTIIFGVIAWIVWPLLDLSNVSKPVAWSTWYQVIIAEYIFKVIFTLLSTPLVYLGVYATKRWVKAL
ncbi:MAG: queuosine precursor transporter [Cytophagales bacterium]|nr:queuosine precursor transporter [Cytophagales bacterium]